jgi:hypothetical protein
MLSLSHPRVELPATCLWTSIHLLSAPLTSQELLLIYLFCFVYFDFHLLMHPTCFFWRMIILANGFSQERDLKTKLEKVTRLVWWFLLIIPAVGKTDTGGTWMKANKAVSERPYLKAKRSGDVA